jgi:L-threonylcarbamoyladenylate synthase
MEVDFRKAAELLKQGKIGVIPTDTVYGLVCMASDAQSVKRLYATKKRENKPGTVIAATTRQLEDLGLKYRYLKAVEQFWPGAVSVCIPTADPALTYLHMNSGSLAVRIPDNGELLGLLEQTGPLQTTSANMPDEPVATTVAGAKKYFGQRVDFYVDGGDLSARQPSTVVRIVDDAIEVLRPGAVDIKPNNELG